MSKRKKRRARGLGPVAGHRPSTARPDDVAQLSPGAWLSRALLEGMLQVAAGLVAGGLLGGLFGVVWGGIVACSIVAIAGIVRGIVRLGPAGIGVGIVAGLAAVKAGQEVRHVVQAHRAIEPLASLAAWDPASSVAAMRFPTVVKDVDLAARRSETTRYKGRTTTTTYVATPLREGTTVVGVSCSATDAREGSFAASWHARDGEVPDLCREAALAAEEGARRAGRAVAAGSATRIVKVYGSEAALRDDHELGATFLGPSILLGVHLVGAFVHRLLGARKSGAPRVR